MNSGDGVVGEDFDSLAFFGFGIDAIGVAEAPAGFERVDALLKRLSAGGGEDGIEAVGCEAMGDLGEIFFFAIGRRISTESLDQCNAIAAPGRGENPRAAEFGELKSE